MRRFEHSGSLSRLLVLGGAFLVVAGCATVSPDDMDSELDRLRAEMQEENQATEARLSDRIDELESRMDGRISALENELRNLRGEFQSTVERMEAAIRFNAPIHFGFDEAEIRDRDRPLLDRFAEVMRSYYQDAVITVEGFTDAAGPREYNMRLGMKRAEAAKEYLVNAGIPEDRIRAVSYGEAQNRQVAPSEHGPGEDGWQNRRVAFVIDFRP